MKNFLVFIKKETIQILRDYRTMLIIILMPVVQIILFGFALSMEVNNVDAAIFSPDRNETVRRIAERLNANPYITFKGYLTNPDGIDRQMRSNAIDIAVVVSKDIDRTLDGNGTDGQGILLVSDATNPVISQMAVGYVRSIVENEITRQAPPIAIDSRMLYNPQMLSSYTFVPGILGLIVLIICTMITSISIVREKETGTMELLLVSPVRPLYVICAKLIPYFILSCVNLASVLLLAAFLLDVPMQGSLIAICGISLLYILLSLALGVLISSIAENQIMAILISAVVMLIPVIMLSGLIFPIENLPALLQYLSCIVPARWYIDAMRTLMIEGLPFSAVIGQTGILILMAAVFITVAVKKFNDKME